MKILSIFATISLFTSPLLATEISQEEVIARTNEIVEEVNGELSWDTIPAIIHRTCTSVGNTLNLSFQAKKEMIEMILHGVIDLTNTPWLPDGLTDPLMKSLSTNFLDLFLPD